MALTLNELDEMERLMKKTSRTKKEEARFQNISVRLRAFCENATPEMEQRAMIGVEADMLNQS